MKMKRKVALLLCAVLLLLAGCQKQQEQPEEENKGYRVYYVSASGDGLAETNYEPTANNFEDLLTELMHQLATSQTVYTSPLVRNVTYQGYARGIDALRVDFSNQYYNLSNIEEVLLRAAVVKTLCQIPGVTNVIITVDGEQLRDSEGSLVPAMNANSFIDTKEGGINSYLYANLTLYFPDAEGHHLKQEIRNVNYSSNMVLERIVIEQLIEGAEHAYGNIFTSDTRIQNLYIQNGVCFIDFESAAAKVPDNNPDPNLVIYAIANSICATCDGITGVQIMINGDSSTLFRGVVNLQQVFGMNNNLVYVEDTAISPENTETANIQAETQPQAAESEAPAPAQEAPVKPEHSAVGVDPELEGA